MVLFSRRDIGALAGTGSLPIQIKSRIAAALVCTGFIPVCILGCGMAASPQPPSLQLPKPVRDLTVVRVGNRVTLHWTTPHETTDNLKIKVPVQAQICRDMSTVPCKPVGTVAATPGKPADYTDTLPASLTAGPLRAISYTVLAINKHGRNAGPSNLARTLAGQAPPTMQTLSADMVERGVVLRWQPVADLPPNTSIRLQRTLLSPPNAHQKTPGGLPQVSEPLDQALQVPLPAQETDPGTALDSSVVFNRKYRYVAERITALKVGTEELQVASAPSVPATIFTRDTFPPAAPTGLAAVPLSAAINNGVPEVDLSWSANTEPDVAQYLVYRRDAGPETSAANAHTSQQIAPESPSQSIVAPAFRDLHVQPGQTYAYSVVAVDNAGNRSSRSAEAVVTVPAH